MNIFSAMKNMNARKASLVVAAVAMVFGSLILLPSFTGPSERPSETQSQGIGCDRFRRVLLNGLAVANPDYRVKFPWPGDDCAVDADGAMLEVGIRGGELNNSSPWSKWVDYRRSTDDLLSMGLADWRLTAALRSIGASDVPHAMTLRLASLPSDKAYIAVVYLKKPMAEEQVRETWNGWVDTVLLSPSVAGKKPLSWDHTLLCVERGFDICAGGVRRPLLEQFRAWVAGLSAEDFDDLAKIGLHAEDLRRASTDGKVYGFVTRDTAASLRHLLSSKKRFVRAIAVVDEVR